MKSKTVFNNLLMAVLITSSVAQSMDAPRPATTYTPAKIKHDYMPFKIQYMDTQGDYVDLTDEKIEEFLGQNIVIALKFSQGNFQLCFTLNGPDQFFMFHSKSKKISPASYQFTDIQKDFRHNLGVLEKETLRSFNEKYKGVLLEEIADISDENIVKREVGNNLSAVTFEGAGFVPFLRQISRSMSKHRYKEGVLNKAMSLFMCYCTSFFAMQEEQDFKMAKWDVNAFSQAISLALGFFKNMGQLQRDDFFAQAVEMKNNLQVSVEEEQLLKSFEEFNNKKYLNTSKVTVPMMNHLDFPKELKSRLGKEKYKHINIWMQLVAENNLIGEIKALRKLQDFFHDKEEPEIKLALRFNAEVILARAYGERSASLEEYIQHSVLKDTYANKIKLLDKMLQMQKSLVENPQLFWKHLIYSELTRLVWKLFPPAGAMPAIDHAVLDGVEAMIARGDFVPMTGYMNALLSLSKKTGDIGDRAKMILPAAGKGLLDLFDFSFETDGTILHPCVNILINMGIIQSELGQRADEILRFYLGTVREKESCGQSVGNAILGEISVLKIRDDETGNCVSDIVACMCDDQLTFPCYYHEAMALTYIETVVGLQYKLNLQACFELLSALEKLGPPYANRVAVVLETISLSFFNNVEHMLYFDDEYNADLRKIIYLLNVLSERKDGIGLQARAVLDALNLKLAQHIEKIITSKNPDDIKFAKRLMSVGSDVATHARYYLKKIGQ